jgi:uncharacterized SAM-binding protein YcdF (DUF218 family)
LFVVFHARLLQWVGSQLIVDSAPGRPDAVLLTAGDHIYGVAAGYGHENPDVAFLKPEFTKTRLEEMGLWPDRISLFHSELMRRGIPDDRRVVLRGPARNEWEATELLNQWLSGHADQHVAILADEFQTRRIKLVVDSVLKSRAVQVGIRPLPDRRYEATNWWKSRAGIRTVVLSAISLSMAAFHQSGSAPPDEWNPDEYENSLRVPASEPPPGALAAVGWLPSVAAWLDIGQRPERVDHIVLLPGDENVRPFVAAALVKAGLANDILLPQNFPSPAVLDGLVEPNHEITVAVLARRGVPADRVRVLELPSDGTIDDARAAAEVLSLEPDSRVAVVTSFYHTRRARLAFRAVFGSRADSFVYISAPATGISPANWWESDQGAQMITTELVKILVYWVGYGPGKYWLLFAVISLVIIRRRWRRARRAHRAALVAAPALTPL